MHAHQRPLRLIDVGPVTEPLEDTQRSSQLSECPFSIPLARAHYAVLVESARLGVRILYLPSPCQNLVEDSSCSLEVPLSSCYHPGNSLRQEEFND